MEKTVEEREQIIQDQLDEIGSRWYALCNVDTEITQFNCPIVCTPMVDPVIANDGKTYSKRALLRYFKSRKSQSPPLPIVSPWSQKDMSEDICPNEDMRRALEEYVAKELRKLRALEEGPRPTTPPTTPNVHPAQQQQQNGNINLQTSSVVQQVEETQQDDIRELREAFTKLDPLRKMLSENLEGWEPPSVTVVGTRSAGKSTVLERLVNLPLFPRSPSLCTKLPIHVRLRQCDREIAETRLVVEKWSTSTKAYESDGAVPPMIIPIINGYEFVLKCMDELVKSENGDDGVSSVSLERRIILEVHHPNVPTIDLIDMPGLEMVDKEESKRTHDILQKQVAAEVGGGGNGIYLLVVRASNDLEHSSDPAIAFVKEHSLLPRCIGVFTKCDFVNEDYFDELVDFVQKGGDVPVGHGWIATMNKTKGFEKLELTDFDRLHKQAVAEASFFRSQDKLIPLISAKKATTSALVGELKKVYMSYLKEKWVPKTLDMIKKKRNDEEYKELSTFGVKLGDSVKKRDDAARKEVQRRLTDGLGDSMDRYQSDIVVTLRENLIQTLRKVDVKDIEMQNVAEHLRSKKHTFHQLWSECVSRSFKFWDEEVQRILNAEWKADVDSGGLYSFNLSIMGFGFTRHVSNFFSGRAVGVAQDEVRAKPPLQLHKYPEFIDKLVAKHKLALDTSKEHLSSELLSLEEIVFDVKHKFLASSPSDDCSRTTLSFDATEVANKVVTILMCEGPTSASIPGFEEGVSVGKEQETCQREREACQRTIQKLQKAWDDIRELFPED